MLISLDLHRPVSRPMNMYPNDIRKNVYKSEPNGNSIISNNDKYGALFLDKY